MPLTDEQKRLALMAEGSNPDLFTIDDETLETIPKPPRPAVQPTGKVAPTVTAPKKQFGLAETVGRNAASGVLPGLVGAAGWSAIAGTALAPETMGLSLLVPLAASIAAGWGAHKLQDTALEQTDVGKRYLEDTALASQQNPKSAVVGQLASVLPTMRPSVSMLKDAARGAMAGNVLKNPALANVALGTAMGTGSGLYTEYADPAPTDYGRLGLNVAGGALINKPANNALARAVGLHSYERPSLYGRPEGKLPPAIESTAEERATEMAAIQAKSAAKSAKKAEEAAKLESEIQKNEAYDKIKAEFDARQKVALEEKNAEKLATFRTTKEEQTKKAPDYSKMTAEELTEALRENQIPPSETLKINPQKTSMKGVEKSNLEVAGDSDLDLRRAEGLKDKYQEKAQTLTEEESPNYGELIDKERLLQSNRELAQHSGAELEVLPKETKTFTNDEGKEVYGEADISSGKAKITQTNPDTGFHELAGHLGFESMPPKLQERYLRGVRSDEKYLAWKAKQEAKGKNFTEREFLAEAAGKDDLRRIAMKDSNFTRDVTSWFRTHVSGTAKAADVVRQLSNRAYYGKGGTVKPPPKVTTIPPPAEDIKLAQEAGEKSPFDKMREDVLGSDVKHPTTEERKVEVENTRQKDLESARYRKQSQEIDQTPVGELETETHNDLLTRVSNMTPEEFKEFSANQKGGATTTSQTLADKVTNEDLPRLKELSNKASKELQEAIESGNYDRASMLSSKPQFFNEIYQTATGTGASGSYLRSTKGESYKPRLKPLDKGEKVYSEEGQTPVGKLEQDDFGLFDDKQTKKPEFKNWFGESKVVDHEGKPLKVFHASNEGGITVFHEGTHFGTKEQANNLKTKKDSEGRSIYPAYIKIENPYHTQDFAQQNWKGIIEKAKGLGHDGVVYDNIVEGRGKSYIVFDPRNIKSASANKGTFDPKNPDIRYSEPDTTPTHIDDVDTTKKGFFKGLEGTFDRVERVSKPLAQAFRNWRSRRDQHLGARNTALKNLGDFTLEDVTRVVAKHDSYFRDETDTIPKFTGDDEEVSKILRDYADYVTDVKGVKTSRSSYSIPHQLNDTTLDLFINKSRIPQALAAQTLWSNHIVKQSGGDVDLTKARHLISDYVGMLGGVRSDFKKKFNSVSNAGKVAEYGLPPELRETNPFKVIEKYGRRVANDLAMYQELETKPEIAAMLGIKNPLTGEIPPVPEGKNFDNIAANQDVRDSMKWVLNSFSGGASENPKTSALVRLVNNALLGTATGVRDTASILNNALPYVHDVVGAKAVIRGMGNLQEHYRGALKTAALQPNIDKVQFNELFDSPDKVTSIIRRGADLLRKWQGREAIENFNRAVTFGIGRELSGAYVGAARAGDVKAAAFVKKFSTLVEGDVTKLKGVELNDALDQMAKNFVDRNQGTYSGEGLPTWAVEGQFAPFVALQKWSIEKSNVIYQDVWKPFMSGENRLPMLTYTLGSILTGAAIQELNKLMTNRKGQDPAWREALASNNPKHIAIEVATLMQLGAYGGVVSDIAKVGVDIGLRGKTPRNIVSFPTATAGAELHEKLADLSEAIQQGENPWEVFKMFAMDMLTHNVQSARVLNNYTPDGKKQAERSDKFRDLRVFKELEGEPIGDIGKSNRYLNSDARKFKQTDDLNEAASELPKLLEKFQERVKTQPEKALKFLHGLKNNSFQTFPSPETMPIEFIKYYQFLEKTQGATEAKERVTDFIKQSELNKLKSAMIP